MTKIPIEAGTDCFISREWIFSVPNFEDWVTPINEQFQAARYNYVTAKSLKNLKIHDLEQKKSPHNGGPLKI